MNVKPGDKLKCIKGNKLLSLGEVYFIQNVARTGGGLNAVKVDGVWHKIEYFEPYMALVK